MPITMTPTIRAATTTDHARIAELLTTGFTGTRLARWLVPDPDQRHRLAELYFDRLVQAAIGEPAVTAHILDDGAAVALWYDHTTASNPTGFTDMRVDLGFLSVLALMCPDAQVHARIAHTRDVLHLTRPAGPHHRLAYLAVDPARRDTDLAKALLEHHHAQLPGALVSAVAQTTTDLAVLSNTGYLPHRPITIDKGLSIWPALRRGGTP